MSTMATLASTPTSASFVERHYHAKCFFSSSNLSDVKIQFGDKSVDAHKIILARGSCYFQRIFAGDGMVQYGRTVQLEDIDTEAAKGMLAWIYDTEYQLNDHYVDKASLSCRTDDSLEARVYAMYLVNLYIAAKMYEVSGLAEEIESRLGHVFMVVIATRFGERAGARVSEVASRLYAEHAVEKGMLYDLRRIFVRQFATAYMIAKDTEDTELLEEVMLKYPGLAVDVLRRITKKDESG
ncbi:Kelch-like protein 5 [Elasticomyces elasticus]|nr:Kelch-like protein 5 [Elasticomyces elasticus]KAK4973534.1 Kelch-like protein 5 [Elasticomyces elasticus]